MTDVPIGGLKPKSCCSARGIIIPPPRGGFEGVPIPDRDREAWMGVNKRPFYDGLRIAPEGACERVSKRVINSLTGV